MEMTTDLIKTYWHQKVNDTKTAETETKIKELFRLHNAGIERLLRRLDKD